MPSGNEESDGVRQVWLPNRRNMLKMLGIGGAAALAGCSSGDPNDGDSTGTPAQTEDTNTDSTEGDSPDTSEAPQTTTTTEASREVSGDYVTGRGTDAVSLNLLGAAAADGESGDRIGSILDGAYGVTPDLEVFPLWADISTEDGKTYTVELRDNLQWGGDYGQMTAEDWVYMIQEVFQAEDNWTGYPNQSDWQRQDEWIPVEQTGELTFEIQLPQVDPAFPLKPVMWGQTAMPKGLIEKYRGDSDGEGLAQDEDVQTMAYAGNLGPYSLESWERESQFVGTRNEDYYMREAENVPEAWQGAPYFNSYTFQVIPEQSTRLSALRTGEITSTGIPTTQVQQFEQEESVEINVAPQAYMTSMIYNQRVNGNFYEVFRQKESRQALARAVNKETIANDILSGYATIAHTFQPKFSKWYSDETVVQTGVGDEYGAELAREMLEPTLEGTSYSYDGDRIVDGNGEQVTLNLVYAQGSDTTEDMNRFIAQEYDKIGLNVELQGLQFNSMLENYVSNSPSNNPDFSGEPEYAAGPYNGGNRDQSVSPEQWDIMTGIVFNTYPRTPSQTRDFVIKQGGINYYGYEPEADFASLYEEASTAVDESTRQEIYAEIFGLESEEQPFNFLNMGVAIGGYQNNVQGPKPEFGSGWDSNIWYFQQG
ncbi:ABC transporter substrate-binding protein [Halomarina oriensis]|uniref:ABC transporter substrate-binding protein n=1 Tax=Halomarina oriensis TaxID=671145 RepID=A0A6B0GLN6_9EURY|nr:ABC transporter substrate-binding protein [Halomarina oriensis]MWG34389.1 ABC transporter substrate-binding protein [Halomarina oriensis]